MHQTPLKIADVLHIQGRTVVAAVTIVVPGPAASFMLVCRNALKRQVEILLRVKTGFTAPALQSGRGYAAQFISHNPDLEVQRDCFA